SLQVRKEKGGDTAVEHALARYLRPFPPVAGGNIVPEKDEDLVGPARAVNGLGLPPVKDGPSRRPRLAHGPSPPAVPPIVRNPNKSTPMLADNRRVGNPISVHFLLWFRVCSPLAGRAAPPTGRRRPAPCPPRYPRNARAPPTRPAAQASASPDGPAAPRFPAPARAKAGRGAPRPASGGARLHGRPGDRRWPRG